MSSSGRRRRFWAGGVSRPHTPPSMRRAEIRASDSFVWVAESVETVTKLCPVSQKSFYATLESIPISATSHRKSPSSASNRIRSTFNHHQPPLPVSQPLSNPLKIPNVSCGKIRADAKSAEIRSHSPKNTKKLKNAMMNRQRALFGRLIFSRKLYHYI